MCYIHFSNHTSSKCPNTPRSVCPKPTQNITIHPPAAPGHPRRNVPLPIPNSAVKPPWAESVPRLETTQERSGPGSFFGPIHFFTQLKPPSFFQLFPPSSTPSTLLTWRDTAAAAATATAAATAAAAAAQLASVNHKSTFGN